MAWLAWKPPAGFQKTREVGLVFAWVCKAVLFCVCTVRIRGRPSQPRSTRIDDVIRLQLRVCLLPASRRIVMMCASLAQWGSGFGEPPHPRGRAVKRKTTNDKRHKASPASSFPASTHVGLRHNLSAEIRQTGVGQASAELADRVHESRRLANTLFCCPTAVS